MHGVDENGETFDTWVVKRSFALLTPICRLGLAVLLCFLVIADPLYAGKDLWSKSIAHTYLVIWHGAMALFFALFAVLAHRPKSHPSMERVLHAFVIGCGLMFAWFGVISWIGVGDFSMVAIAQLTIATVFTMPGKLRRTCHAWSAATIAVVIAWIDSTGKFLGEMQFVNLLVIVAVAWVIEGFMWRTALALFTEKCRVALERQRADSVLYNALPAHVADDLKYHRQARGQRHEHMAVLFADLVGFTAYAARVNPDEVLKVLNAIFSAFDELADAYQVEKIKTIGDAYMVISPDAPDRLADFALDLLETLEHYNAHSGNRFCLRVGMHIGPTISGVVGNKRLAYDVWGDAVNLASRMESLGEPGRVHVSAEVVAALQTTHAFEVRGELAVKGKGTHSTFYLLPQKAARVSIRPVLPPASGYTP